MTTSSRRPIIVAFAGALGIGLGCHPDTQVGPANDAGLPPAADILIDESVQRRILGRIAHQVAVALRDSLTRNTVYEAMRNSHYPEHKIHFGPWLRAGGRGLLRAMAAGARVDEAASLALVDSAIDLEFYMPVKEHWAQWSGSAELIVATALRDHEIPIAYGIHGRPVRLESAEDPPSIPTLAVVPAETDFDAVTTQRLASNASAATNSARMTFAYVPGDYEGFLMGNPEFELHSYSRPPSAVYTAQYRCSGEHPSQTGYYYDQNDGSWTGSVVLLTSQDLQVALSQGARLVFDMWEDDRDACVIRKHPNWRQVVEGVIVGFFGTAAMMQVIQGGYQSCSSDSDCLAFLWAGLATPFLFIEAFQNDDFVGQLIPTSVVGVSYGDANFAIVNEDANIVGRVFVADVPVIVNAPPPPGFAVSISGPTQVRPSAMCTWSVSATGAPGEVAFTWYRDEVLVGNGAFYEGQAPGTETTFQLVVQAVSGDEGAVAQLSVTTSSQAPECFDM